MCELHFFLGACYTWINLLITFVTANKLTTHTSALSPMPIPTTIATMNPSIPSQILMPTVGILNSEVKMTNDVNKRLHDEDDDYDNNWEKKICLIANLWHNAFLYYV